MSAKPTGNAVCAHTMLIWSEGDIVLVERENTMMILSFAIRPIMKIMIRKKTISIMSAMLGYSHDHGRQHHMFSFFNGDTRADQCHPDQNIACDFFGPLNRVDQHITIIDAEHRDDRHRNQEKIAQIQAYSR